MSPLEEVSLLDAGIWPDHADVGRDALHDDTNGATHITDGSDADAPDTNDGELRDAVLSDVRHDAPPGGSRCGGQQDAYERSCSHCVQADAIVTVACRRPDFLRCHIYSVDCIDDDFVQCWRASETPGLAEGCRAFCARARDAGITSCSW